MNHTVFDSEKVHQLSIYIILYTALYIAGIVARSFFRQSSISPQIGGISHFQLSPIEGTRTAHE